MYKVKHTLISLGIILSIVIGLMPARTSAEALSAAESIGTAEQSASDDADGELTGQTASDDADGESTGQTASESDAADASQGAGITVQEDIPLVGDISSSGFTVSPSGTYVNQVITGKGTYFSEIHNLLNCTGQGAEGMAAYCLEPAKTAPSSSVSYTEVGMTDTASSTAADKAGAAAVHMYGYGGLSSINNDVIGLAEANTNMGGSYGLYVIDGTAYTGLLINGTFFKMSSIEAHAVTAAVIHKLNGSRITSVTGSLLSSDSEVAGAYEYLYSLGSHASLNTSVYGWDHTNSILTAYTVPSQELEITLQKANGEWVSVPADSTSSTFDWSPYTINGKINYRVTYSAFRCESKLIKSNASGKSGNITYTHEASTSFKDYSQSNGYYDYMTISEGSGNNIPVSISYGKLESSTRQTIRLGVIDETYGGFPPCDGVEFTQTATITVDADTLKSGRTLNLTVNVPNAAGHTPYYGDGDGKDGSYCASRFFIASKYQDIAVASPNSELSGCSANIYARQATGTTKLIKGSALTNVTDGNSCYSLRLAKYGLYKSEENARQRTNAVKTFITDEKGEASISGLPLGTYYIAEITPPEGYTLDQNIYTAVLKDGGTVCVSLSDTPKYNTPGLIIYKESDKGSPLADAEFTVSFYSSYISSEDGLTDVSPARTWYLKSDEDGCVYLDEEHLISGDDFYKDNSGNIILPYGTLTVKESKAPEGYIADDSLRMYSINKDTVFTADNVSNGRVYTNESFEAYVRITKYDITTGNPILNNPATFRIWSYDEENYVEFTDEETGEVYTDLRADDSGMVYTPDPLFYGSYGICEAVEPVGYYNETPDCFYDFEISMEKDYEEYAGENGESARLLSCDIYNTPLTGRLELYKTGDVRSWDEETEEFVTDVCPLANVEFDIIAATDILTPDNNGIVMYAEGETVETIITDEDGLATSSDALPLGSYIVREHVPAGYEETDDIEVNITADDITLETETDGRISKIIPVTLSVHNTLKIPELMTSAMDNISGTNTGVVTEHALLTDVIEYTNLIVGETYTVRGTIIEKESGLAYASDGTEVTGETTFICESENGTVRVCFNYDASDMAGKSIVLYETLYKDDEITAVHADIDNTDQTITYPPAENPPAENPPVETPPDTPRTNDMFYIIPYTAVGLITLITILSFVIKKRRKNI